jgi:hypothetical protein
MKIYFDTLIKNQSNIRNLESNADKSWWLVAPGSVLKKELTEMNVPFYSLDDLQEPGVYFIDVNGDPNWWTGQAGEQGPKHILRCLPDNILELTKNKKLRLIICADREGGPMVNDIIDGFAATTSAIQDMELPNQSVLIMQGNKNIEQDYIKWLDGNQPLFEVMYSNHFGKIFWDNTMPTSPVVSASIRNVDAKDYNSLNRVYRPHRGAHFCKLVNEKILDKGIVSGNEVRYSDAAAANLSGFKIATVNRIFRTHFPKFIDGDWSVTNAANQYNVDIYVNSLLSVITETIFVDNTVFLTEKLFKPITMGHPFLVIAGAGTLNGLKELGFEVDFLGFGTEYDSIVDPKTRFDVVHKILKEWVESSREYKLEKIKESLPAIEHNFKHIRESNFYHDAIREAVKRSEVYYAQN